MHKIHLNAFGLTVVILLFLADIIGIAVLFDEYMKIVRFSFDTPGKVSMVEAAYLGALWTQMCAKIIFGILVNVMAFILIYISTGISHGSAQNSDQNSYAWNQPKK